MLGLVRSVQPKSNALQDFLHIYKVWFVSSSLVHSFSHLRARCFCASWVPGTVLSTGVSQSNDANMFNVLEEFKELTGEGGSFIKQMIQLSI